MIDSIVVNSMVDNMVVVGCTKNEIYNHEVDYIQMCDHDTSALWDILQEITNKRDWYNKVFDPSITEKWRAEVHTTCKTGEGYIKESVDDLIDYALNILRTSAQGCALDLGCDWDFNDACDACIEAAMKEEGITDKEEFMDGMDMNELDCPHPLCACKCPDHALENYIEYRTDVSNQSAPQSVPKCTAKSVKKTGKTVVTPVCKQVKKSGVLDAQLVAKLKAMVYDMTARADPDWHPWSNNQVLDIVHPSLYCYVSGVSKHTDGKAYASADATETYSWLPADIAISATGAVKFKSYINNLRGADVKYVPLFEHLLSYFVEPFERVLKRPLKGTAAQVIVKVGSTILTEANSKFGGGSWHVEGVPAEHIIGTALYYLDVEGITPSFLEFRKPTIINEENVDYPQSNSKFTDHHYGIEDHHDGVMNRYLGLIKAQSDAYVVFPNTLQHRIKEFELDPAYEAGVRTVIVFFLIDPDRRILSTADVPDQFGKMALTDAHKYRELLMHDRKFFVNELNDTVYERPFSLCEH